MFFSHSEAHLHRRRALALLFAIFSFLGHAACLKAEARLAANSNPRHIDGSSIGGPLDIWKDWLVHGGDDPSFADPQFDDSAWKAISGDKPLSTYGIHDQPIVWYRLHVQVPPSETDLAPMLHRFYGSFEAYANGVRIGQLGQMSGGGGEALLNQFHLVMKIPPAAIDHGNLVIAIRAAIGNSTKGEKYYGGIYDAELGRSTDLLPNATLAAFRDLTSGGYEFLLQSVTLLILLALLIALPEQREYLYLTLAFAFAWTHTLFINAASTPWFNISYFAFYAEEWILPTCQTLALVEAIHLILDKLWGKWVRIIQFSLLTYLVLDQCVGIALHLGLQSSPSSRVFWGVLWFAAWLPFILVLPGLLLWEWIKRRNDDAGFLLVPVLVACAWQGFSRSYGVLQSTGVSKGYSQMVPVLLLSVTWEELAAAFVNLSLLVYIIFRVVRTVRAGAHYEAEVEAAHTVQQVLLSRSTQAMPGFKVETVYFPAS